MCKECTPLVADETQALGDAQRQLDAARRRRTGGRAVVSLVVVVLPQLREQQLEDHLAQRRQPLEGERQALVEGAADRGLLREGATDEAEHLQLELHVGVGRAGGRRVASTTGGGGLQQQKEALDRGQPRLLLAVEHGLAEQQHEVVAQLEPLLEPAPQGRKVGRVASVLGRPGRVRAAPHSSPNATHKGSRALSSGAATEAGR